MEIIDEMEIVKRGVYGGAAGYLSFSGDMDLAIVIRTGVIKDGMVHAQAGAGGAGQGRGGAQGGGLFRGERGRGGARGGKEAGRRGSSVKAAAAECILLSLVLLGRDEAVPTTRSRGKEKKEDEEEGV
jgi:hypothetical protein